MKWAVLDLKMKIGFEMKLERIKLESSNRKCKVTVEVGKLRLKIERSKFHGQ